MMSIIVITLTTTDATPVVINLNTSTSTFNDPRDSANNNISFKLSEAQLASINGRPFGIKITRTTTPNDLSVGIDNGEILGILNEVPFFRETDSSLVEYNSAGIFYSWKR